MEADVEKLKRRIRQLELARDRWKARATFKQQRLRSLAVKARDLALSRDRWKDQALLAGSADAPAPSQDDPPRLLAMPAPGDRAGQGGEKRRGRR